MAACWSPGLCQDSTILSEVDRVESPKALGQRWPVIDGWVKSLINSHWHFILQQNGKTELYEWPEDSQEEKNRIDAPPAQTTAADLRSQLLRYVQADPQVRQRN